MKHTFERRSNRIPKTPRSYSKAFARTVRREARGKNIDVKGRTKS